MLTVDFRRLSIGPGDSILDVGCGSGRHTGAAAAVAGVLAVGADRSTGDLAEARKRLRWHEDLGQCGGRWALMAADIRQLPYPDAVFDLVICCEVLEHIPDHRRAVAEIARVLKPGKDMVVSVPRRMPEQICWALSRGYRTASGGHVRIYRLPALTRLLAAAGLQLRAVRYAHSLHTPYWWLKCLLGVDRSSLAPVRLYHRFLVWDLMKKPKLIRRLDALLNPVLGKSLVLYLRKD